MIDNIRTKRETRKRNAVNSVKIFGGKRFLIRRVEIDQKKLIMSNDDAGVEKAVKRGRTRTGPKDSKAFFLPAIPVYKRH